MSIALQNLKTCINKRWISAAAPLARSFNTSTSTMMASADTKQPNFKSFEIYRWSLII
ncbi:unnamed protein product [Rhizopus stolonifer]